MEWRCLSKNKLVFQPSGPSDVRRVIFFVEILSMCELSREEFFLLSIDMALKYEHGKIFELETMAPSFDGCLPLSISLIERNSLSFAKRRCNVCDNHTPMC